MFVAHPLIGSPPLPVPPLLLAAVAVLLAAVVATRLRPAARREPGTEASGGGAGGGPRGLAVSRAVAALAFVALVAVARAGPAAEPRNLAAVAVVHLIWPLLLVASALAGPVVWRALDPWRALGAVERLFGAPPPAVPSGPGPPAAGPPVWPAVVTGGAWAVFLGWYAVSVDPRALAAVLAAYAVVLVAGCVALGRDRWLAAADAVGLLATWTGLLRRGRLTSWAPPPGAAVLLGAVLGGVLFARVRLSSVWGDLALRPNAVGLQRAGAVAAVVTGAAVAYAAERWAARRGAPGSVAAAFVPVVAATAVATVLRRALVAAQLLPALATDPFERGWRLLGPLGRTGAVDLNPWGTAVQQALAVAVVALGGVAGAWVLARRVRGVRARDPAAFAVYVATFLAAFVVASR